MNSSRLPVLFEDRTIGFWVVLVLVVPAVFGAVSGLAMGASAGVYLVLQVIAAVGGLAAGLEHRRPGEAAQRGFCAGLIFATSIVVAHGIAGGTDHGLLPQPALLPGIAAVIGAGLAAIGSLLRQRIESAA